MKRIRLLVLAVSSVPAVAQTVSIPGPEAYQARRAAYAGEDAYARASSLLDRGKYDEALSAFEKVQSGPRLEGALYWKAYCLNKLGRRDEAVTTLAKLQHDYPSSRWSDDARALQAEVNQNGGKPANEVASADASNEELKLLAINGLLAADPDRALPQLERLLKGNSSPRVKDRALFVLTQTGSPKAAEILTGVAKGGANPDLQLRAIRYIGMSGSEEAKKQLTSIYASSNDVEVKKSIIRSLMTSGAADQLLTVATSEKDPNLRSEAIRNLGVMHKTPVQLYTPNAEPRVKKEIINGLFVSGDAKAMVELARKETDLGMKKQIVSQLAVMNGNKDAADYMMEILK